MHHDRGRPKPTLATEPRLYIALDEAKRSELIIMIIIIIAPLTIVMTISGDI